MWGEKDAFILKKSQEDDNDNKNEYVRVSLRPSNRIVSFFIIRVNSP